MKFQVKNNTGAPIEYEEEIHSLCNFAQQRIGFERPPSIFLDDDKRNATNTLAKTGYYDPNTLEIHVFATGRHPKDILRSISHELVHHGQNMRGELDTEGYSGKGYAQKNPKLRRAEMEANDPMLFRDWEDSLKEKENTTYNERRNRKMSIKDWKNKELSENVSRKWGFSMNLEKLNESQEDEKEKDGNKSTDKYDDNPALKGGQKNLPDALQQGIISSKGGEKKPRGEDEEEKPEEEEKEKVDEAAIGGDKEYLEKLLAKYGADAKIGDVAKKEKDGKVEEYMDPRDDVHKRKSKTLDQVKADEKEKKVQEASSMSGGNAHGHAGGRRKQ